MNQKKKFQLQSFNIFVSWLIELPNVRRPVFFLNKFRKLEMQNIYFYFQDDKWMQWNDAMSQMYLGHLTTVLILFDKWNVVYCGENA